jgi:uncharacterized protein with HEPN domain
MPNNRLNLLSILEAIKKIKLYSSDFKNGEDFYHDSKSFDATMMQFIVIGEMIDKIDEPFKTEHSQIEWLKIKNFRNIVAHNYFGIDADEIWDIIQSKIEPLEKEINFIL